MTTNELTFYVYEHHRPDTEECFYVGKGRGKRAWEITSNRNRYHARIYKKLARLGLKVEIRIIATDLSEADAFTLEIERIAFWKEQGVLLANNTNGGEGPSGWIHSAEIRARIAEARKKQEFTEETRARLREAQRKRQDEGRGTHLSDEAKAKISASMTGKVVPEERRARISATMKGRSPTEEHRANLSASQKGRVFTPEHRAKATAALQAPEVRAKLSAAAKARPPMSAETRAKISATKKARRQPAIAKLIQ